MCIAGLVLALTLGQVISEEPVEPTPSAPVAWHSSRQLLGLSAGASAWSGLRGLGPIATPPGWGPFAPAGFAMMVSYRLNLVRRGPFELLVGPSMALFVTRGGSPASVPLDQSGAPNSDLRLVATGLPITLDARVQLAEGTLRPFLELGGGFYGLQIATEQGDIASITDRVVLDRWRPTAWVGGGGDVRFGAPELCWGLFAEVRLYAVNFGPTGGFSGVGSVHGPIYTFTVGGLIGFGH